MRVREILIVSQWRITSVVTPIVSQKEDRRDERDHAVFHVERRRFQALFSGAHQRASRNGPSHDEARPWWGVSRGLSGDFMYITIPAAGTRAVHCWLTGRRSRRNRVVRTTCLVPSAWEKEWKNVFIHFSNEKSCPLSFFCFFFRVCTINNVARISLTSGSNNRTRVNVNVVHESAGVI